jgi:hypothetical protein
MAGDRLKEIKEHTDGKNLKDQVDRLNITWRPGWDDPIGPVKLDYLEHLLRSYLEVIPRVAHTLDAVVDHLEKGLPEGKPFIRSELRPDVGADGLNDLSGTLRLLDERLSKLEGAARANK